MISWPDYDRGSANERDMLKAVLDQQRAIMLWKLDGLGFEAATRPMTPTGTNLLGMVKHLAWVERGWFCEFIDDQKVDDPGTPEDPDADFRIEPGDTIESVRALYVEAIGEADEVIEKAPSLDITGERRGGPRSLRWVLAHMIEETARHAGQADIIREQIDGATGYYPTD